MTDKYVEVLGDYDGILYVEKEDGTRYNNHTKVEFDKGIQVEEYGLYYQFKDKQLVGYSAYHATGLTEDDDLTLIENKLWGTRGEYGDLEYMFRPLKSLSDDHIKNIVRDYDNGKLKVGEDYIKYFKERLGVSQSDTLSE